MKVALPFWLGLVSLPLTGCTEVRRWVGAESANRRPASEMPVEESPQIEHLTVDGRVGPLGIESLRPKFAWELKSTERGLTQSGYQILVAREPKTLDQDIGDVWNSGRVHLGTSIQVPYAGPALQSAQAYYWKVRVWDQKGRSSAWSPQASWQMGLLNARDWRGAQWIGYEALPDDKIVVPMVHGGPKATARTVQPLFRREFRVTKPLKKASLFISGLGHFDLSLNGRKVGDHFLDPGWTRYDRQALYVAFDVTAQVQPGMNAIGVMLGNGFYNVPGERYRKMTGAYGNPKLIAMLDIDYADGTSDTLVTDSLWKTHAGPITFSSIYGGEDYDANLEQADWDLPFFPAIGWKAATHVQGPPALVEQISEPLKFFQVFEGRKVKSTRKFTLYDLGQNASGIPQLTVRGRKGARVRMMTGEILNRDGTVNQSVSGHPTSFEYTLKGQGIEIWQPRFTYSGFRYVQVEVQGKPAPEVLSIKGLHTRSSAPEIGTFSSSSPLFNRIHTLIDWAVRSNLASVLTDCPHREKLGWLSDAYLTAGYIRYRYGMYPLLRKIVQDMRLAQTPSGLVPDIAPEYVEFHGPFRDSPEWGSAAVIVPWKIYEWYGDRDLLAESYPMMKRYVEYLRQKANDGILDHGLGDWCDLGPKPPGEAQLTPRALTATATYYYDATILERTARLLGKKNDEKEYHRLATEIKDAYNSLFFDARASRFSTGSQTAAAISLQFGLTLPQFERKVLDELVREIKENDYRLTSGNVGFPSLLRVLEARDHSEVIFKMNHRSDVPGYGYQLKLGGTSLAETWAARPGEGANNHAMLGQLMEWFYSGIGGIRPAQDGIAYSRIEIRPEIVGDLQWAKTEFRSPYGPITTDWKREGKDFVLSVSIPGNTRASIFLPASREHRILEGGRPITERPEIVAAGYQGNRAVFSVGSGTYQFVVRAP